MTPNNHRFIRSFLHACVIITNAQLTIHYDSECLRFRVPTRSIDDVMEAMVLRPASHYIAGC